MYFDFDRFDDPQPTRVGTLLRNELRTIEGNERFRLAITIEGHCDERGSEEYNLALGERRANSA